MKITNHSVSSLLIAISVSLFSINYAVADVLSESNFDNNAPITANQDEHESVAPDQIETIADDQGSEGWFEDFLKKIGADGEFDPDKLIDFSILPGPFYNPEMSLGVGVSAVGLYQVDPEDKVSQLSSLVINGLASINGALGAAVESKTFFNDDNQRLFISAEFFDVPDVYYGIGYDNNHNDNNRVELSSRTYGINPMFHQRISTNSFVGVGFDAHYAEASDVDILDAAVSVDPLFDSSHSVGINLLLNFDTRDNVLNPQTGRIAQIEVGVYRKDLGSKTDFEAYNALYSTYYKVSEDDIFAWQIRGRFTHGDVPWDQLSKIGGGDSLRGYTTGRYRDKQMLLAQAEYRQHISGRHGMVYWVGAGVISEDFNDLISSNLLPNVGVGYRFEVKPKVNLRLDFALGDGDSGFYFNVNEAF
ncbi:BamA/TamA family outer membrane protein [Shewanella donghaensis]|uniref:BamA/TamA family outer membrane protein n=1 Tax=Shewanella donghaensis TaxID=238836 RepID=UPI001184306C|nr:BamA/TamA family outer membrane protein [Shewanella donghaensis]